MKTLFLKKVAPVAVIAFGIAGAFATMSMQNASKGNPPKIGYVMNAQGACNIPTDCSTDGNQLCRLNGASGPQAFGKNPQGNCSEVLYRPAN
ncbi:hypothetical protein CLU81_5181 [Flavobacterium sp. 9]|uniref:DUF6520 family protein n=1 Tax=Flavobacterium sp. 9 TaxID=2035198 RepID=UPI000C19CEEC|nr:DUF6520 family protein [Flavobacterium sp. 9]PIF34526.1 hypothetical protein CLU81_5181 [Flavobacterium sp. 9]